MSFAKARRVFNTPVKNFTEAKLFLAKQLEAFDYKTIYCGCRVNGKKIDLETCGYRVQKNRNRATRLEWEHVVPAEAFGQSFIEWREGALACQHRTRMLKGRKCAETNAEFNKMESDLYNLFPEIGELNGLRSNYSMASISYSKKNFGGCAVKLADRKFEPQDNAKGIVARTYMNLDNRYPGHGVISAKNRELFASWNQLYPITKLECQRWHRFEIFNGYKHLFTPQCLGLLLE